MKVFGTKEWCSTNENAIFGCSHNCLYCYARAMAIRFNRATSETWKNEVVRENALKKFFTKRKGRIMFPSTHDITPINLDICVTFLKNILAPDNKVLIVSKPHLECVQKISSELSNFKEKILFRFTVGSVNSQVLKFWEPGAPSFEERLEALKFAFFEGFQTSLSCEPFLDDTIGDLINRTSPFITDSIWIGKGNMFIQRVKINGGNLEQINAAKKLVQSQGDVQIRELYEKNRLNPLIKWKESIKKVVGIPISTEVGFDI